MAFSVTGSPVVAVNDGTANEEAQHIADVGVFLLQCTVKFF